MLLYYRIRQLLASLISLLPVNLYTFGPAGLRPALITVVVCLFIIYSLENQEKPYKLQLVILYDEQLSTLYKVSSD